MPRLSFLNLCTSCSLGSSLKEATSWMNSYFPYSKREEQGTTKGMTLLGPLIPVAAPRWGWYLLKEVLEGCSVEQGRSLHPLIGMLALAWGIPIDGRLLLIHPMPIAEVIPGKARREEPLPSAWNGPRDVP